MCNVLIRCILLLHFRKEIPLHSLSINRQLNDCYEYGHDAYQRILALLGMRNHKVGQYNRMHGVLLGLGFFGFRFLIQ